MQSFDDSEREAQNFVYLRIRQSYEVLKDPIRREAYGKWRYGGENVVVEFKTAIQRVLDHYL